MMGFYTYLHIRKSDSKVFYVGKGRGRRANSTHGRSNYWQRVVNKHGFSAEILSFWETEDEAFEHEKLLILCFKEMKAPLVNMTDGGEGASGNYPSDETRQKMSLSHLGKKMPKSPEHRVKISKSLQGKSPGNKGKSPSDETRRLQSIAKIGRVLSPETRQKMSAAHKGKQKSPETRVRMSESRIGKPMLDETKAKLSALAKARFEAKRQLVTNCAHPATIGLQTGLRISIPPSTS
jgi:hypothetical protein